MYSIEEKIIEKFSLLILSADLKNDVEVISEKYNLPKAFKKEKGVMNIFDELFKDKSLFKEIEQLRIKYNLPSLYIFYFHGYIIFDRLIKGIYPLAYLFANDNFESNLKSGYVDLRIYKDTTIDDIRAIWPFVLELFGKKNTRNKKLPQLKRDIEIFRLMQSGNSAKTTMKKINGKSDKVIGYDYVRKIKNKTKSRIGKTSSPKRSL